MGNLKGRRSHGLKFATQNPTTYKRRIGSLSSPSKSPHNKRSKSSFSKPTPLKSPSLFRNLLAYPDLVRISPIQPEKRQSIFPPRPSHSYQRTVIKRKLSLTSPSSLSTTLEQITSTDILNESFGSDRQRGGHIGISTNKLIPDVIKELSDQGQAAAFLKFFSLVKNKQIPLDNIAFNLFLVTVNWFDSDDTRAMRYSDATLRFFWLGGKLFGGRFIRFMSGLKNETDLLSGHSVLSPSENKINFACPSESVLRDNNAMMHPHGLLSSMIDLRVEKDNGKGSYVLMFDRKKIRKGGDVDLLEFEEGSSLQDRKEANSRDKANILRVLILKMMI